MRTQLCTHLAAFAALCLFALPGCDSGGTLDGGEDGTTTNVDAAVEVELVEANAATATIGNVDVSASVGDLQVAQATVAAGDVAAGAVSADGGVVASGPVDVSGDVTVDVAELTVSNAPAPASLANVELVYGDSCQVDGVGPSACTGANYLDGAALSAEWTATLQSACPTAGAELLHFTPIVLQDVDGQTLVTFAAAVNCP